MNIHFRKAQLSDKETIFSWLDTPHMQESWDNSQEHRDDILNFMNGTPQPSTFFNILFTYWIGFINENPLSFILTHPEIDSPETPEPYRSFVSKTGTTYGLDFGIGNEAYLGKGLAAPAIEAFIQFMVKDVDPKADTFLIDPFLNNPRAIHVYEKAGFKKVADFTQKGGYFDQKKGVLLVKSLKRETSV